MVTEASVGEEEGAPATFDTYQVEHVSKKSNVSKKVLFRGRRGPTAPTVILDSGGSLDLRRLQGCGRVKPTT